MKMAGMADHSLLKAIAVSEVCEHQDLSAGV